MKKVISIIPARGGSVGIPGKNLKDFCGKPLIAWAIEASKASKHVQRTIVSTDCIEIAEVAKSYGAEVPFLRPKELASNEIAIEPTLKHTVDFLIKSENYRPDLVCLLLPTNPLRTTEIIDSCVKIAEGGDYDCVLTVNEIPANHTPFWSLVQREGKACFYFEKDFNSRFARRQDFPERCFAKNDLVFVFQPRNLFADKPSMFGKGDKVKFCETPSFLDGDINTTSEWIITENLFRFFQSEEGKKISDEFKNI
jgi:CMP-N,N'-diacetyllegionaminic acid synthase